MKKTFVVLMAILALSLVIGFAGCSNDTTTSSNENNSGSSETTVSIVGTWYYSGSESFPDTLVFSSSGTVKGYADGEIVLSAGYVASGGNVTISEEDEDGNNINTAGTYTSTTLTLVYLGKQIVLTR